jgi:3-methylfumaryl-CoA hydratase
LGELAERAEVITSGPAEAFAGLLGVQTPDLELGSMLPFLWHWLYLLERPPQAVLGPDGHPERDSIPAPPGPGRRRMFAGGRVLQHGPLRTGLPATRRTWQASSVEKLGRSGVLNFVTVRSEISQDGQVIIVEDQNIVYREGPSANTAQAPPGSAGIARGRPGTDLHEWAVEINPVLLFRFSALTYTAHRIHYDRDYARQVEGYPGLVVHGPLQALLMAELGRRFASPPPPRCEYAYRLVAPLFEGQGLTVSAASKGDLVLLTTRDSSERQTAIAVLGPLMASSASASVMDAELDGL